MKYQLYTDVVILTNIPKFALQKGDVVKIIDFVDGFYMLEAYDVFGKTIGVFSLTEDKIKNFQKNEVFHARELEFA